MNKQNSNECGGFKPPKGKLDTQLYPECKGTPTDRDVAKKTREKRKKNKKSKKKAMNTTAKKKEYDPNPWAVCTESIGKTEGTTERSEWSEDAKERYERCVKKVKKKQNKKSFNMKRMRHESQSIDDEHLIGREVGYMNEQEIIDFLKAKGYNLFREEFPWGRTLAFRNSQGEELYISNGILVDERQLVNDVIENWRPVTDQEMAILNELKQKYASAKTMQKKAQRGTNANEYLQAFEKALELAEKYGVLGNYNITLKDVAEKKLQEQGDISGPIETEQDGEVDWDERNRRVNLRKEIDSLTYAHEILASLENALAHGFVK